MRTSRLFTRTSRIIQQRCWSSTKPASFVGRRYFRSDVSSGSALDQGLADLTANPEDCRSVYDNWASNYDKDVEEWGYDMPTKVASLLAQYLSNDKEKELEILDAGAGDGLSGMALRESPSFSNCHLTGADLSTQMLEGAKKRGCYDELLTLDLNQPPFPFQSQSFDAITCVGTMTYVNPNAGTLKEFCRIVKPNGLIFYTNRTDKLEPFRPVEQALVDQGWWKLTHDTGPLPYLPNHPEFKDDIQVVIFVYQRTDKPMV